MKILNIISIVIILFSVTIFEIPLFSQGKPMQSLYNVDISFSEDTMDVNMDDNSSRDIQVSGNLTYESKNPITQEIHLYSNTDNDLNTSVTPETMTFTQSGSGEFHVECHIPGNISINHFSLHVVSVIYNGLVVNRMYVTSDQMEITINRSASQDDENNQKPDNKDKRSDEVDLEQISLWAIPSIIIIMIFVVIIFLKRKQSG